MGRGDAVHPALERVEDYGVRTVGAALREGGGDPRDGADVARLWVAAKPPLLLEEEVLDVGAVTGGCSATLDAVGPVHLGDGGAHGLSRRGERGGVFSRCCCPEAPTLLYFRRSRSPGGRRRPRGDRHSSRRSRSPWRPQPAAAGRTLPCHRVRQNLSSLALFRRPQAAMWRQAFFSSLTLTMAAAAGRSRPQPAAAGRSRPQPAERFRVKECDPLKTFPRYYSPIQSRIKG